jgi:hypothetical protein
MKNIHVLPTDKPSRLWINNLLQGKLELSKEVLIGSNTAQNIYITSNEEIKDRNCWVTNGEDIFKPLDDYSLEYANNYWEKIILTTDPTLIANGVQAIDDEFLEWFVKNPSCKFVETERLEDGQYFDYLEDNSVIEGIYENYKIIIPKEKPKQETILEQIDQNNPVTRGSTALVYKQETLEEAAERLYPFALDGIGNIEVDKKNHFINGAKWQAERMGLMEIELRHTKTLLASCEKALEDRDKQAERMYSEEEVLTILKSHKEFIVKELKGLSSFKNEKVWFEQFKKK